MGTAESQTDTITKLKRIAWLSSRDKARQFDCVMHHFNESSLEDCFHQQDGKKAVGMDGVTKMQYAKHLNQNLKSLILRMRRMAYRPGAVRKVLIPKEGSPGKTRPLGISNFEDKLVQKMTQRVLESIYDPVFLDCSYGFRPGRSCHDAIKALHQYLFGHKVSMVIDIDLKSYFDTIDHQLLEDMLRNKINDERFMRYINRMFRAGVLSEGELSVSEEGVPQGSICSPILSNIFAHYVIDEWFQDVVKQCCRGEVELFRYCDDAVIACQYEGDAQRIVHALAKRLAKYKLQLNEDKTRCVRFSQREVSQGVRQETFDFLGFTFYLGRSRKGHYIPMVKSSGKRLRVKLKRVSEWARGARHKYKSMELWRIFCAKLRGHIQYYGVSFNMRYVTRFLEAAKRILFKWLNRRSDRRSFNWEQFNLFLQANPLPVAKVHHALF
ncbi:MAG: group II intron reverse transcriptase/maturase [Candidatus Thiodiazotropha sp. (ex Myrtea sp. 'scaly one' KF741663)]|nr:group II intron reverse transcriptase/maturase [Candidatus Thiodiazotropha sp. (ex Myrtea sp. 'scaly one' KF741663)]